MVKKAKRSKKRMDDEIMTPEEWAKLDRESREKVVAWLKTFDWAQDIEYTKTDESVPVDIEFNIVKDGVKYPCAIEVKNRSNEAYNKYNDVMIDKGKYSEIDRDLKSGKYVKVLVINTYTDKDIIRVADFKKVSYFKSIYAPKTTLVKGGSQKKEWQPHAFWNNFTYFKKELKDDGSIHWQSWTWHSPYGI